MRLFSLLVLVFLFLQGCMSSTRLAQPADESLSHLRANLEFLASDALEGREATTRGADVAAQFLASRLQQYGLKPFGDNDSYFQNFNLRVSSYNLESIAVLRDSSGSADTLRMGQQFVPRYTIDSTLASGSSEVVFVRYGIDAPEVGYNDYAGLDVRGKTVVVLGDVPATADSSALAKYSSSRARRKIAALQEAHTLIYLLAPEWLRYFSRFGARALREQFSYPYEEDSKAMPTVMYLDSTTALNLFGVNDKSYGEFFDWLGEDPLPAGHDLGYTIDYKITFNKELHNAKNVVAVLEGNDPELADQLVTVGAHYDHLGTMETRDGRTLVFNGADDNGSGTVAILEAARLMAAEKSNRRPVVFMFFTAEEKGLYGARYLAENWERRDDIIVNINMDMVGREHPDTMFAIGSGKLSSEFYDIVEEANKASSNFTFDYTLDDEGHRQQIYYRSDHWQFAKRGIPVVFLTDYHGEDYHRPSDTAEKINYNKVYKTAQLAAEIAKRVANLDHKLKVDKPVVYERDR